jgi:hypothetical protein
MVFRVYSRLNAVKKIIPRLYFLSTVTDVLRVILKNRFYPLSVPLPLKLILLKQLLSKIVWVFPFDPVQNTGLPREKFLFIFLEIF